MLFADWCNKYFIVKKQKVKQSTWYNKYYYNYNRYVLPVFGGLQIEDIKPIELELFFCSDGVKDKSSSVQEKLYSLLYGIFDKAYQNDIIAKNPMQAVELSEYKAVKQKRVYTQEQGDILFDFCKRHRHGATVALLLKAGHRRGEALGLRHCDIDADNSIISVNQAIVEQSGRGVITSPKTKTSVRIQPVEKELIDLVLERAELGTGEKLLFPSTYGSPQSPHNWHNRRYVVLMRDFQREQPNIPILNPHELRHTCGTLLYRKGVDLRTIQKFMGHASIEVTSKIYVHDDVEHMREALGFAPGLTTSI